MQNRKRIFENMFLIVSTLASLFVITELVMNSQGKSLCVSEGCKLTAQSARFGDISIFIMGLGTFLLLGVLAFVNRGRRDPHIERLINLVLVTALAGEGFFMGYLAFRIHTLCLFCAVICGFIVCLGLIRLLAGERDLIAGFAAFVAVFAFQYLILPAGVPVNLPLQERLILFYSRDCKHCTEIIRELDERKINVAHLSVEGYAGFLKNIGIDSIPTLLVNDPYQKVFLTGKETIMRYLVSCTEPKNSVKNSQSAPARKTTGEKKSIVPEEGATPAIDIFNQPNLLTTPGTSLPDAGMCKEEEVCK